MAEPIASLALAPRALFTDVDGTLTTGGKVTAASYAALVAATEAALPVVIVTGRPAGWGEAMARLWPVAAVVTENGGVTLVPRGNRLVRHYGVPEAELPALRRRMLAAVDRVAAAVPGAQLSADSRYREVDLAIDWNEEAALAASAADHMVTLLREDGFTALRSSVHVNFGPPGCSKLTACRTVVAELWGADPDDLSPYVYVGDALNDAPVFAGFPHSVGVANILSVWAELPHHPRYLTEHAEGRGFEEVIAVALARRAAAV